jgi:hypothetical protein
LGGMESRMCLDVDGVRVEGHGGVFGPALIKLPFRLPKPWSKPFARLPRFACFTRRIVLCDSSVFIWLPCVACISLPPERLMTSRLLPLTATWSSVSISGKVWNATLERTSGVLYYFPGRSFSVTKLKHSSLRLISYCFHIGV